MKRVSWLLVVMLVFALAAAGCGGQEAPAVGEPEGEGAAEAVGELDYPTTSINTIVPYSAGGGTDIYARLVASLIDLKGQPMVITNVTGGSGSIGTMEAWNSQNDGYTTLFHSLTALVGGYYAGNFEQKMIDEFVPVCSVFATYYVLCTRTGEYVDMRSLVEYAKANPGMSLAVAGVGGASHIVALNFVQASGVEINIVPYDGAADVKAALQGGHVDMAVLATSEAYDYVEAGYFDELAVSSYERLDAIPDVPTFIEEGVDCAFTHRNGYLLPKGTDPQIAQYLADQIYAVTQNQEFMDTVAGMSAIIDYLDADELYEWLWEMDAMIEPFADQMQ